MLLVNFLNFLMLAVKRLSLRQKHRNQWSILARLYGKTRAGELNNFKGILGEGAFLPWTMGNLMESAPLFIWDVKCPKIMVNDRGFSPYLRRLKAQIYTSSTRPSTTLYSQKRKTVIDINKLPKS
jgi:hypothetical protein